MSESKKTFSTTLTFEKTTPGTFRFKEDVNPTNPPTIRSLYVEKYLFGNSAPKRIKVTVEVIE